MGLYEIILEYMGLYGIIWYYMGLYEIIWEITILKYLFSLSQALSQTSRPMIKITLTNVSWR